MKLDGKRQTITTLYTHKSFLIKKDKNAAQTYKKIYDVYGVNAAIETVRQKWFTQLFK